MEITGIFLPFEKMPNGNGRIYDRDSIDASVFKSYFKKVKDGKALGESFITRDPDDKFEEIVSTEVTHIIKELEITDKGIFGKAIILDTPRGNLIKQWQKNLDFIIRPRCIGSVDYTNHVTIHKIISFDILDSLNDAFNPQSYKNKRIKLTELKKNEKHTSS